MNIKEAIKKLESCGWDWWYSYGEDGYSQEHATPHFIKLQEPQTFRKFLCFKIKEKPVIHVFKTHHFKDGEQDTWREDVIKLVQTVEQK